MMKGFTDLVWEHRTTAIVRAGSRSAAEKAMNAAVRGGVRIVEFTLTTPGALDLIGEFAARRDLVVGAGTVLTAAQAKAAAAAGARFLVSPVFDREVVDAAAGLGVASIPGVHTPNEMLAAHRAGATMLKLFPAPAGGPLALRSVLAPCPFLKVVPTNGVDLDNIVDWLRAGAWGVGLVRPLFLPQDVESGNEAAIEARARTFREAAMSVERGQPPSPPDPS